MAQALLPDGGGAGGKLRARRRSGATKTPYARPLTGRHAPLALRSSAAASEINTNKSWLSKLVSPASRLIANGASRLLSSVFSKRVTAYSSSSSSDDDGDRNSSEDEEEEEGEEEEEDEPVNNDIVAEANKQSRELTQANAQKSESKLTEIEQVLADKTFTRDEFVYLTELLQSRIVDNSSGSKEHEEQVRTEQHGGDDPRNAAFAEAQRWREERRKAREESMNGGWDRVWCGNVSSPAMLPDVSNNSGSSPVDVAKAYMGAQPIWASASTHSLQNEIYQDESVRGQLNGFSPIPRAKEGWSIGNGQLEDRYMTPPPARTWSRIQNNARILYSRPSYRQTPYHRFIQPQVSTRGIDKTMENGNGTPSSTWTQLQSPVTGGHEMLKRKISVVNDGWASIGPIRGIHQNPMGMVSSFSSPFKEFDSSATKSGPLIPLVLPGLEVGQTTFSFDKKPIDMKKHNHACSSFQARENASKVYGVPPQSGVTAWKFLEHVDRTAHCPKENSAEVQLAAARDKSPNQLNMLAQGDSDIEHGKYKSNGRTSMFTSTVASLENPSPSSIGDAILRESQAKSVRSDANKVVLSGSNVPEEKNEGFQMSALEDSQEPDDKLHGSRKAETSMENRASKCTSIATHGNPHPKICDPIPTFKFGSGNTSGDPVFSFVASGNTYADTSLPKFDFKFESKPELLFSIAVEAAAAAVASTSTPQIIMGSKAINLTSKYAPQELGMTWKSSAVFSNFGTDQPFQKAGKGLNQDTSRFQHEEAAGPVTASSFMLGSTGTALSSFAPASSTCSSASLQSISCSAPPTSLFAGSSSIPFWSTSSPSPSTSLFSSGASIVSLGSSKLGGFSLASIPPLGLSNSAFGTSTVAHFGVGCTPVFGSCPSASFGKNASAMFGTFHFASAASSGLSATASPPCGSGSTSSFTLGSSTPSFGLGSSSSIVCGSSLPISNSATSFGSGRSPPFGCQNGPLFGSGSSSFTGRIPAFGSGNTSSFGLAQPVRAAILKSASQSMTASFGYGFGSTSPSSTEFEMTGANAATNGSSVLAASIGVSLGTGFSFNSATGATSGQVASASADSQMPQKSAFGLTSSTSPISTLTFGSAPPVSAPFDGISNDQMNVEDSMVDDVAQSSSPGPSVFGRQHPSLASPVFVLGSESSAASTASQLSTPVSNPFASGAQNTFASVGGIEPLGQRENTLGAGGEKSRRRIIRPKRDKTRRK